MYEIWKYIAQIQDGQFSYVWILDKEFATFEDMKDYYFEKKIAGIFKRKMVIAGKEVDE